MSCKAHLGYVERKSPPGAGKPQAEDGTRHWKSRVGQEHGCGFQSHDEDHGAQGDLKAHFRCLEGG